MRSGLLVLLALALPSSASAYEVKRTQAGEPVRWNVDRVTVELHDAVPPELTSGDAFDALEIATDAWTGQGGPSLRLDYRIRRESPSTSPGVQLSWPDSWEHAPHLLAVTSTTYVEATGVILDADILVRRDADVGFLREGETEQHDLGAVVTHEMGHVMGLGESEEPNASMWPNIRRGQTSQRALTADDQAGVMALYRDAVLVPPSGCGRASVAPRHSVSALFALLFIAMVAVASRRRGLTFGTVAVVLIAAAAMQERPLHAQAPISRHLSHPALEAPVRHGVVGPVRRALAFRGADGTLRTRLTVGTEDIVVPGGCVGGVCMEFGGQLPPRIGQTIAVDRTRTSWVHRPADRWAGGWTAPPPLEGR